MFEYDEEVVEILLAESFEFKRLYDKHQVLKQEVDNANAGNGGMDEMELERMKKEKLLLKDNMQKIIEDYQGEHAA